MSYKLPVHDFEWRKVLVSFHKKFMHNYGQGSHNGYILEVDVHYPIKRAQSFTTLTRKNED